MSQYELVAQYSSAHEVMPNEREREKENELHFNEINKRR